MACFPFLGQDVVWTSFSMSIMQSNNRSRFSMYNSSS